MRFHGSLEEEQASRTIRVRSHLYAFRSNQTRHLVCTRNHVTQKLQRTTNTHITTGTYAEYREHTASNQARTDTGTHIILAQGTFLKEFLHQSIIVLSGGFHQGLMQLHRLIHFLGGDFQYIRNSTFRFPTIHLHF